VGQIGSTGTTGTTGATGTTGRTGTTGPTGILGPALFNLYTRTDTSASSIVFPTSNSIAKVVSDSIDSYILTRESYSLSYFNFSLDGVSPAPSRVGLSINGSTIGITDPTYGFNFYQDYTSGQSFLILYNGSIWPTSFTYVSTDIFTIILRLQKLVMLVMFMI
jgi:hypothetical protein